MVMVIMMIDNDVNSNKTTNTVLTIAVTNKPSGLGRHVL